MVKNTANRPSQSNQMMVKTSDGRVVVNEAYSRPTKRKKSKNTQHSILAEMHSSAHGPANVSRGQLDIATDGIRNMANTLKNHPGASQATCHDPETVAYVAEVTPDNFAKCAVAIDNYNDAIENVKNPEDYDFGSFMDGIVGTEAASISEIPGIKRIHADHIHDEGSESFSEYEWRTGKSVDDERII